MVLVLLMKVEDLQNIILNNPVIFCTQSIVCKIVTGGMKPT